MFLNDPLQYYLTHKHHLTNTLSPMSKSHLNYHPPLNPFNNIFIWMRVDDNASWALLCAYLCPCVISKTNRLTYNIKVK